MLVLVACFCFSFLAYSGIIFHVCVGDCCSATSMAVCWAS